MTNENDNEMTKSIAKSKPVNPSEKKKETMEDKSDEKEKS
jgi:hypothetical protein